MLFKRFFEEISEGPQNIFSFLSDRSTPTANVTGVCFYAKVARLLSTFLVHINYFSLVKSSDGEKPGKRFMTK